MNPLRSAYRSALRLISLNRPSPAVKQSPLVISYAAALVLAFAMPDIQLTNPPVLVAGVALLALATAYAVAASRSPRLASFAVLVPLADLVAIGCLRTGTGGPQSPFSALLLLPVLWIAGQQGRRNIAVAALGTALAIMLPYVFTLQAPTTPSEWMRGVFTPAVFLVAAAIINQMARALRSQYRAATRLADEKESMLQRSIEYGALLQESEAKYRAADRMFRGVWAAVTEQSVIATDPEGLVVAWNPGASKLLGPTNEQAEQIAHIFDFHDEAELLAYAKELGYPHGATVLNPGFSALVEHARQGVAESREWNYVRPDGSHVPVLQSVTARRNDKGELVGYLFIASDQTQAREVAKLKDEFVGLISHELRTPLSSILGYLELLRDDEDRPLSQEQLQYLSVAERNANRLLRLVGDLLFTAQVESGRFPIELGEVELGAIVRASVDTASPAGASAGVELAVVVPERPIMIRGDALRLGQAVDNLISNAIKFTPAGGTVTVRIGESGDRVQIQVQDTGMGIPREELELLFGRFFRASTATRNAVPGVGLGLTITKAIVTAHEGSIEVASEVGTGTTFTITLPRGA